MVRAKDFTFSLRLWSNNVPLARISLMVIHGLKQTQLSFPHQEPSDSC